MSELSAQCDELRAMAASVGLEVPQVATLMIGAADAIDRLDAENVKLHELIADVHEALYADKAGMFHRLTLASMEDDMRELGVEVTG